MSKKPYNPEDPKDIADAEKKLEDTARDLEIVMRSPEGRRLVYRIIYEMCHATQTSHVPGCSDSTAFNEGSRAVGLALLSEAIVEPNYLLMLKENLPND